jgi:hypothetical protein
VGEVAGAGLQFAFGGREKRVHALFIAFGAARGEAGAAAVNHPLGLTFYCK